MVFSPAQVSLTELSLYRSSSKWFILLDLNRFSERSPNVIFMQMSTLEAFYYLQVYKTRVLARNLNFDWYFIYKTNFCLQAIANFNAIFHAHSIRSLWWLPRQLVVENLIRCQWTFLMSFAYFTKSLLSSATK